MDKPARSDEHVEVLLSPSDKISPFSFVRVMTPPSMVIYVLVGSTGVVGSGLCAVGVHWGMLLLHVARAHTQT